MAIRVLMVDDDPVHLELSEQFLKRQSAEYEIVSAETSETAMNLILKDEFDVAVCDIDLGENQPTGLDILQQVRVNENDIPVIIFTGKSREEFAIQALNLGADYYIRKSASKIEGLYAELSYYILTSVKKRRTERALVESERRLRESEAKLEEAQRIAHLGHWDWDIIKDNIVWSDEIYRIFGLAPQEFKATYDAFLSSVHVDDRNFVRDSVERAIHENEKYSIDHRILLPDGSIRFVHEEAEVTFNRDNRAVRMMGTVHDITERVCQELLLREERDKAQKYLDLANTMILALDTKFNVTMINQRGCEFLGSGEADIIGTNWIEDFVPLNSRENASNYLKSLIAGETRDSCEMVIETLRGGQKKILCRDRIITDDEGNVTTILCSFQEIAIDEKEKTLKTETEQKDTLDMLKKQREELSDFAHTMSHDLKNIFHNMLGFIELVEVEQNFTHLKKLRSLVNDTGAMVDHSVALADAGLIIEETMNVELTSLVKEVASSIIPESVEYVQDQLPVVKADKRKVAQIFRNLFDNAIQHGKPSKIEVMSVKTDNAYRIKVLNDGKPIPEVQHSRLFLRGFSTSKIGQGYGLAIVKRLVEAHGWTIKLLKEKETTFEIEIPMKL